MENELAGKFELVEKLGSGAFGVVYLVKKKGDDGEIYASKILEREDVTFNQEVQMIKLVNSPYIIKYIDSGEGSVILNGELKGEKQYLAMEYAEKGNLLDYVIRIKKGFGESNGKYLFYKLLKGVQQMHEQGVCHRDLKLDNVILDSNFNPKLCDFGFATHVKNQQGEDVHCETVGTQNYFAPEIWYRIPYSGIKVDIFDLGIMLLTLVTNKIGFIGAHQNDYYYRYIFYNQIPLYWQAISPQINGISEELKDLFIRMVTPDYRNRLSIEDILKHPFMEEVTKMTEEQKENKEKEILNEFKEREIILNQAKVSLKHTDGLNIDEGGAGFKGDNENYIEYFNEEMRPKEIVKITKDIQDYIKVTGEMNPSTFMNILGNKLTEELQEECELKSHEEKIQFNVTFFEEEKNEEKQKSTEFKIDEETNKNIMSLFGNKMPEFGTKNENSEIKIKMVELMEEGYLITFKKKKGTSEQFYENIEKVKKIIDEILDN